MKPFSFFVALVTAFAVSACTTVRSSVMSFSDPAVSYSGKSFAFRPLKEQEFSLEFQDYAGYVASKLLAYGMVQAPSDQADFVVLLKYNVDSGRTVSGTTPIYGQTGGGSAAHSGMVDGPDGSATYSATYSGTTYTPETFSVIDQIEWSRTDYKSEFRLLIVDGQSNVSGKPRPVYQTKCH